MHREFVDSANRNGGSIFCRTRDAKKPIEWQADSFASCLLMPEWYVREAFYRVCGPKPLILYNVESAYAGPICFDPCVANWPAIADCVRRAGNFSNVSKQAMIIRLQDLCLVRNETDTPMVWRKSVAAA
jgi:Zn-dependent peptidase ImmA (M78 family)